MSGPEPSALFVRAYLQGLREQGWIDGQTFVLERRSAEGDPGRAPAIFAAIVTAGVDVITVGGERWLIDAARAATSTIPIVANIVDDPVASGLVASLARPGGNVTGIAEAPGPEIEAKRLQLLLEIVPTARRIAFLASPRRITQFAGIAVPPGVTIVPAAMESLNQLEQTLAAIRSAGADGLIVSNDGPIFWSLQRIAAFAAENRLPAIFAFREAIDPGGLMSYGPVNRFRQLGRMTARFLDGARVGEVPVEAPVSYNLTINAKAAAALGLPVPATLAAQAAEVIE
jgi:putative ABC transport system substrate-binding protein